MTYLHNSYKYLFLILFFLSCDNKKTLSDSNKPVMTIIEPETKTIGSNIDSLNIKGLQYHAFGDKARVFSELEDEFASYTTNRFGTKDSALSMDGLTQYVVIDNHDNINPKIEITVSLWYKPIAFRGSGNDVLVFKGADNPKDKPYVQYFLGVTGNEYPSEKARGSFKFALGINNKYISIKTPNDFWSPNKWYNITGTYNEKTLKLFVNGKLITSKAVQGGITIFDTDLFIGKHAQSPKLFTPGSYDDLKIYNRALTDEEVLLLSK